MKNHILIMSLFVFMQAALADPVCLPPSSTILEILETNIIPTKVEEPIYYGPQNSYLKKVAFYDCGSTGVRVLLADINCLTGEYDIILSNRYDAEFNMVGNYPERIFLLISVIGQLEQVYGKIEHVAVATAGFRRAGKVGAHLIHDIKSRAGINDIRIIDQLDEGKLAFSGVLLNNPHLNSNEMIVLDVGGASTQITYKDGDELNVLGARVAAALFFEKVMQQIYKGDSALTTPYPASAEHIQGMYSLAENILKSEIGFGLDVYKLKDSFGSKSVVYGVGPFFMYLARPHAERVEDARLTFFTKEQIEKAIASFENKPVDELGGIALNDQENIYFKLELTSLVFLWVLMDLSGVQVIEPVESGNTDGLVYEFLEGKCDKSEEVKR